MHFPIECSFPLKSYEHSLFFTCPHFYQYSELSPESPIISAFSILDFFQTASPNPFKLLPEIRCKGLKPAWLSSLGNNTTSTLPVFCVC